MSLSREQAEENHHIRVGNINSLSILRPYRRRGLAKRLMTLSRVYFSCITIVLIVVDFDM